MSYVGDSMKALWTTLFQMRRAPTTAQFPEELRPRPERYRASFALPNDEHGEIACLGCMSCEKICPSGVIKVKAAPKRESPITGKKRAYPDDFTIDLSACIYCELCVQVCNSDAIVMVSRPEVPTYAREELVLTMEKLIANASERPLAWSNGSRLEEMQLGPPKEKPAKAEKKAANEAAPQPPADAPAIGAAKEGA